MIHIRHALARAASAISVAVASFFDRGVDGLISQFTRLDSKLEAFLARKKAAIEAELALQSASYKRQEAAAVSERNVRAQSTQRMDDHGAEIARATRIRDAVQGLIGN